MRTRGNMDDIVCFASHSCGNGWVYPMVSRQPYTLERSDGRAKAKI